MSHGFSLWDSAIGFAKFLRFNTKYADQLKGKTVLEYGCGCGLLGCVLHRLNSKDADRAAPRPTLVITDLADVVENAMACMASNSVPAALVSTESLDASPTSAGGIPLRPAVLAMAHSWGSAVYPLFERTGMVPFDFILGTDVLYSRALMPRLMRSMALAAWASDHWPSSPSEGGSSSPDTPPLPFQRLKSFEEEGASSATEEASSGVKPSRPRCTIFLANEIRCTATHEAFLKLGPLLYEPFKQLNKRAVGAEIADSGVIIFEARLKRELDSPAKIIAVINDFIKAEGLPTLDAPL